ncbi:MAG: hypothetical protein WBD90_08650, partial [Xanthobacteraceae bacterium]
GVLVASNERHSNPFAKLLGLGVKDEDDEDEETVASAAPTATPSPAVASADAPQAAVPVPAKRPVIAAIEHGAQVAEKATVAAAVKVADAASKVKLIRTADAAPLQVLSQLPAPTPVSSQTAEHAPLQPALPTEPARSNGPTANQVIADRGYWQGPADGTVVANPSVAAKLQRSALATPNAAAKPANPDMATGAIGPFANPNANLGGSSLALSYADTSANVALPAPAPAAPMGIAALRAAAPSQSASLQTVPVQVAPVQGTSSDTTVAVKRAGNQASSVIMTASSTSVTVVKSDARFENPWMRAIVLSPSVHQFLTTMALGAGDFRLLADLMVKPSSAVMMRFAADPNPGLDHDHFTGAAIAFMSTVNYPARTASLQ